MKMVTAIIRPKRLDDVVDALEVIGIDKLTVIEVTGVGSAVPTKDAFSPESTRLPSLSPRRKIEIAVARERVPKVAATICAAAATNKLGDGKIFVAKLEDVLRTRSRENGVNAL